MIWSRFAVSVTLCKRYKVQWWVVLFWRHSHSHSPHFVLICWVGGWGWSDKRVAVGSEQIDPVQLCRASPGIVLSVRSVFCLYLYDGIVHARMASDRYTPREQKQKKTVCLRFLVVGCFAIRRLACVSR
ncbi:unnamed protein product [Ascophyllum nodosum]